MSHIVKSELAGLGTAPWDRPGYQDGIPGIAVGGDQYV